MANKHTSIEINGRRYNAVSGQLMASSAKKAPRSIDGVLKGAPHTASLTHARPAHQPAAKAASHHAKPSATLMRHAVHKPSGSTLALTDNSAAIVVPKLSLYSVDPKREARAAKVALSSKISHFISSPAGGHDYAEPKPVFTESLKPVQTAPVAAPKAAAKPDIFERALANASSHKQKPLSRQQLKHAKKANRSRKRKALNVSASALAVLLVVGFIAYQNVANVTLKVAASKAGFAATLPAYRPAGFAIGKFSYSPGNVAVNFHSNSDSRHFALIEKPSNWDSATLLNDYVASAGGSSYQTVQTAGQTIYIYGQGSATWVNNGVWYQVQGNNSLSDRQLAELAASM